MSVDSAPDSGAPVRTTLDGILRRNARRDPGGLALMDPSDRARFADGAPRSFTWMEAEQAVGAVAYRLHRLGLAPGSVVALHLPNVAEHLLTVLGIMRAGMVAAPMPLLWRRADIVAALEACGARAIVAAARIGDIAHAELGMQAAAELFPVRYVCGLGRPLPDGVIPMDDLFKPHTGEAVESESNISPVVPLAAITWETGTGRPMAVARAHGELMSGGLEVLLEGRIAQGSRVLCTLPPSSFAGLSAGLVGWLLTGGTLALHHPGDPDTLAVQLREQPCDAAVVPGPLVPGLLESGMLPQTLHRLIGVWRAPERLASSPPCVRAGLRVTDVLAFGETGLVAVRRDEAGRPGSLPAGVLAAPRGVPSGMPVAETGRSATGTLVMRGPMVPDALLRPIRGGQQGRSGAAEEWADTGYPCRPSQDRASLELTGPPAGVVGIGGYRFRISELQDLAQTALPGAGIAALPAAFGGHRLAGHADDPSAVCAALTERGINPLIVDAFAGRSTDARAAAPQD